LIGGGGGKPLKSSGEKLPRIKESRGESTKDFAKKMTAIRGGINTPSDLCSITEGVIIHPLKKGRLLNTKEMRGGKRKEEQRKDEEKVLITQEHNLYC